MDTRPASSARSIEGRAAEGGGQDGGGLGQLIQSGMKSIKGLEGVGGLQGGLRGVGGLQGGLESPGGLAGRLGAFFSPGPGAQRPKPPRGPPDDADDAGDNLPLNSPAPGAALPRQMVEARCKRSGVLQHVEYGIALLGGPLAFLLAQALGILAASLMIAIVHLVYRRRPRARQRYSRLMMILAFLSTMLAFNVAGYGAIIYTVDGTVLYREAERASALFAGSALGLLVVAAVHFYGRRAIDSATPEAEDDSAALEPSLLSIYVVVVCVFTAIPHFICNR